MRNVCLTIALVAAAGAAHAGPITQTVPDAYDSTPGTGVFLGPMTIGARTYQLLMHADLLTDLVGLELTGMRWRLPVSATGPWPTQDISYANYDIYLSDSVNPADRSLTFANNVVGAQTQVRSGSLDVSANSFPSGGSPNAFGPTVSFGSGYIYNGGNLLVEIRHEGNGFGSRSLDALTTSTSGYGSLFSAAWQSSYTATTGLQGNFTIFQFIAVPTPGAAALLGVGAIFAARRRR